MQRFHRNLVLVMTVILMIPSLSLASDFQETHAFSLLLQYTVYDEGTWSQNAKNPDIQYHYPEAGGMLMVQCTPMDVSPYTEETVYENTLPTLMKVTDGASKNCVRYFEKRFICNACYALHSKAAFTLNGEDVHDNTYFIVTPACLVSLHFIDSTSLGSYPQESIPYILASLDFLANAR